MKTIEHRRHSNRTKPSPHLNAEGVLNARKLGETYHSRAHFDLVITSPKKRAIETAVAMGFAVDETEPLLAEIPLESDEFPSWNSGFGILAEALPGTELTTRFLKKLRGLFTNLIEKVPDGGKILVVSHGGVIEWSALACLPEKAATLGEAIGLCEGVQLTWEEGKWTSVKALRT